jgi:hypothetical protein
MPGSGGANFDDCLSEKSHCSKQVTLDDFPTTREKQANGVVWAWGLILRRCLDSCKEFNFRDLLFNAMQGYDRPVEVT